MLQFDPGAHRYTYDGQWVPSVTKILQATGTIDTRWYNRAGRDRGSSVHELLEFVDLFGEGAEEAPEELRGYVRAYESFLETSGFRAEEVEHPLYYRFSSGEEYAGMLDRAGPLNGRRVVLDIKTGSPAAWHKLQAAAYALADGRGAAQGMLYLDKTGRFRLSMVDAADAMNARIFWEAEVKRFYAQGLAREGV